MSLNIEFSKLKQTIIDDLELFFCKLDDFLAGCF